MVKEFKKADLKEWQVVQTRKGQRFLVIGNNLASHLTYQSLSHYDKTLKSSISAENDIVKVYDVRKDVQIFSINDLLLEKSLEVVWNREEPKKMTKEDIEKALGYAIEILGLPKNDEGEEEKPKKPWWKLD